MQHHQFIWLLLVLLCLAGCGNEGDINTERQKMNEGSGVKVANSQAQSKFGQVPPPVAAYCGTCHQIPSPSDLPSSIWRETILPRMGWRLGVYNAEMTRKAVIALDPVGLSKADYAVIYPEEPLVSPQDWQSIKDYYLGASPATLATDTVALAGTTELFNPRFPNAFISPPAGTLVQIAPAGKGILYGDANKKRLYYFDQNLVVRSELEIGEGITAYRRGTNGSTYATVIGSFSPTDAKLGSVWEFLPNGKTRKIIDGLARPTDLVVVDADGDGQEELIITEFGKLAGRLSWFKPTASGWEAHTLTSSPGAVSVKIADLDRDNHPDLLVLFAQGDERIVAYFNRPTGFESRTLLRFPPSYGSSSLNTFDWNQDGLMDLVYTAGDNADYVPIIKPYHGVYLFLQQPDGTFEQEWFQYLPGAYAAEVADFDGDGDLDVTATSFFPDFLRQPSQGLVYFEQTTPGKFSPHALPSSKMGRWIRLSSGDLDQDGDLDLLTASLAFETVPDNGEVAGWVKNGLPFIWWENQSIND